MAHKVLIVDDEPNIVASLEFLMARQGYETLVVDDGDRVLPAVERFRPDLVLLDVMLPHRDGFEVCQQLKSRADAPTVVMLTAKGRESEMAKGVAVGADAYVTKPFSTRDLVAQVARLLAARGPRSDGTGVSGDHPASDDRAPGRGRPGDPGVSP